MEGTDFEPFTESQYLSLTAVTKLLLAAYPAMSADKIVGHSDIAPGRKTDPGPHFDWGRYRQSLAS
jgi:AmpD protein